MTEDAAGHHRALARVLEESDIPADDTSEDSLVPDPHTDRTRRFTHTSFSRMNTTWSDADRAKLGEIRYAANQTLAADFKVALDLMDEIYLCVREPLRDGDRIVLGPDGRPRWAEDEHGNPVEDWTALGDAQRRRFLNAITTHLFEWEQAQADLWGQAMFSKVMWEERFANGYLALPGYEGKGRPTIDDRTQFGHQSSIEARYFAVFCSMLSRKADALVRAMVRVQRLLETTYPA